MTPFNKSSTAGPDVAMKDWLRPGLSGAHKTSSPVYYRQQPHRGKKCFWEGTHRSASPAETLERIRPYLGRCGITRIANITGLDRIGIPVTLAIRPNGKTLSNSSGKGVSLDAAMVSGAMEGIELFHAEETELPTFQLPYEGLGESRIPMEDLPFTAHNLFNQWWPYTWTMGWDIMNQEEVPVPWWAIQMANHASRLRDLHTFQVTSNGLASGNNLLEAINAGLFEAIERDAAACQEFALRQSGRMYPAVELARVEYPVVCELIDRLLKADMGLALFDITSDIAVPVYMAYVYDQNISSVGVGQGFGAHLDPETAMSRAITEACQGRAVAIAGSRDDILRHTYAPLKSPRNRELVLRLLSQAKPSRRLLVSEAAETFEEDTQLILRKLQDAGITKAIVVDLTQEGMPIKVVKVIVPGLENHLLDFCQLGRRAHAFVERSTYASDHLPGAFSSAE